MRRFMRAAYLCIRSPPALAAAPDSPLGAVRSRTAAVLTMPPNKSRRS
jgi:hypothetical protein